MQKPQLPVSSSSKPNRVILLCLNKANPLWTSKVHALQELVEQSQKKTAFQIFHFPKRIVSLANPNTCKGNVKVRASC